METNDLSLITDPDNYAIKPTGASSVMYRTKSGELTPVKKGDKVLDAHSIGKDTLRYGQIVDITEGHPTYGTLIIVDYDTPLMRTWKEENGTIHNEVDQSAGLHVISEGGLQGRLIKILPTQAAVDKEKAALAAKAKVKKPSPKSKS